MNRRGHRGKVDGNQQAVIDALKAAGWQVLVLSAVGDGVPDLLGYHSIRGVWRLIEVKQRRGTLTKDQIKFAYTWPVVIVRNEAEAMAL
jgi:hypothetical protein